MVEEIFLIGWLEELSIMLTDNKQIYLRHKPEISTMRKKVKRNQFVSQEVGNIYRGQTLLPSVTIVHIKNS